MPNKWEPDYWFLDANDFTLAPRLQDWAASYADIDVAFGLAQPYTSGNKVEPLIDGEAYMFDLYQWFSALASGDVLLIAGWQFSKEQFLWAGDKDNSKLDVMLRHLVSQRVRVGLIAFDNPVPTLGPQDFVASVNKAAAGTAVIDGTKLGTAHHEKVVFVGANAFNQSWAYVGGMDLAADRLDSSKHNRAKPEHLLGQWGWHDIALKVAGRAIMQVWANFADRWDSIHGALGQHRFVPPSWATNVAGLQLNPGTQHVQVLRTVGPASPRKQQRYMQNGEQTILWALTEAISKAERYIYIEEQFLWDGWLAVVLGRELARKPQLHLIVVLAAETDMPLSFGAYNFYLRTEFFKRVLRVQHANQIAFGTLNRVHPYGLYRSARPHKAIYVHSKLMIIDDRYVAVGSANVNERSMYIDTELTLGVVDGTTRVVRWQRGNVTSAETVCVFAKNLREKLWEEHSGIKPTLNDPLQALFECFPPYCHLNNGANTPWPTTEHASKRLQQGHLRCYINREGRPLLTQTWQQTLDRTTRTIIYD